MELLFVLIAGTTLWVAIDASGRDFSCTRFAHSQLAWVLGSLLIWPAFFPLYLAQRSRAPRRRYVAER